jgi:hypothetical protein
MTRNHAYSPLTDTQIYGHAIALNYLEKAIARNKRKIRSLLKPDLDLEQKTMIQESLRDGRFPLAANYWSPRLSLEAENYQGLYLALKRAAGDILLTNENGRQLLNGEEQYQKLMLEPGYYIKNVEYAHIDQNLASWQMDFKDANVIELCVGDCIKAGETLKKIGKNNHPAHYVLWDSIGVQELAKHAAREITDKAGYASDNISFVSKNIFSKEFIEYLKSINDNLPKSAKPTLVLLRGATLNNFTEEEILKLLKTLHEFFSPGTIFRIGVDNTLDIPTLARAYQTPSFLHWVLNGGYFALEKFAPGKVDPLNIFPYVDIFDKAKYKIYYGKSGYDQDSITGVDEFAKIIPGIDFEPNQPISLGSHDFTFPHLNSDEITKFSERTMERYCRVTGWAINSIERFNSTNPDFRHVNSNTYRLANLAVA